MKRYLDLFNRVAGRIGPSLGKHQLEVLAGTWLRSAALKVQKRRWTEGDGPESAHAGIFFSVWVNEKALKKQRAYYNIHALRLRNLGAYSLRGREFAEAFRARFASQKASWPSVSTEYGPQTLMQGWIPLDDGRLERDVTRLVERFIPLSATIDALLDQRKSA
jgi:hypothetical protein